MKEFRLFIDCLLIGKEKLYYTFIISSEVAPRVFSDIKELINYISSLTSKNYKNISIIVYFQQLEMLFGEIFKVKASIANLKIIPYLRNKDSLFKFVCVFSVDEKKNRVTFFEIESHLDNFNIPLSIPFHETRLHLLSNFPDDIEKSQYHNKQIVSVLTIEYNNLYKERLNYLLESFTRINYCPTSIPHDNALKLLKLHLKNKTLFLSRISTSLLKHLRSTKQRLNIPPKVINTNLLEENDYTTKYYVYKQNEAPLYWKILLKKYSFPYIFEEKVLSISELLKRIDNYHDLGFVYIKVTGIGELSNVSNYLNVQLSEILLLTVNEFRYLHDKGYTFEIIISYLSRKAVSKSRGHQIAYPLLKHFNTKIMLPYISKISPDIGYLAKRFRRGFLNSILCIFSIETIRKAYFITGKVTINSIELEPLFPHVDYYLESYTRLFLYNLLEDELSRGNRILYADTNTIICSKPLLEKFISLKRSKRNYFSRIARYTFQKMAEIHEISDIINEVDLKSSYSSRVTLRSILKQR